MAVGDLVRQDWPRGRAVVLGAPGFPEGNYLKVAIAVKD